MSIIEPGSAEWYEARLGKPTASNFEKIITPVTLEPSRQARPYMMRLIAERLLKDSTEDQLKVEWIEHGKAHEPHAYQQFEFTNEVKLQPAGFIPSKDGRYGCTPDALVVGRREGVEIKCPAPWTQLSYLLDGPGADYRPQVQGQILAAELECNHFYSYHPRMPAKHLVILPDQEFLEKFDPILQRFLDTLDELTERAKSLGAYIVTPGRVQRPLDRAYGEQAEQEDQPIQMIVPDGGTIMDAG